MRVSYYISSMLHLFVAFCVFAIGVAFLAFPYAPGLRAFAYEVLKDRPEVLMYIGIAFLGFFALLFITFCFLYRKGYYTIEMKGCKAKIDEALIHTYVEGYWRERMGNKRTKVKVLIHNNQAIEIVAPQDFDLSDEDRLEEVQNELGALLARRLGYKKEFLLTVRA